MIDAITRRISTPPVAGLFSVLMVWFGLALGHTLVVIQHSILPMGALDTTLSLLVGFGGFALVWVGMKQGELRGTILGYIGGNLIWCGWFEWTWRYFGHWLGIEPVMDQDMQILSPELIMIQSTVLLVVAMLVFLGANKDTRCRMFMWFHRNFRLRPDRMTAGYKRQFARITAMETVFLIWTIYLFAIFINDPRGIRYDSIAAMALTVGFVVWGIYLVNKILRIRGLAPAFRYGIATGNICWLPIEAFARWGLYPEIWVKPFEYPLLMSAVCGLFLVGAVSMYRGNSEQMQASPA